MANNRELLIRFSNLEKMMCFFELLDNWKVQRKISRNYDCIIFEGYNDEIAFSTSHINEKFLESTGVIKQDIKLEKTSSYFKLNEDLIYILYKDLKNKHDLIFNEDNYTNETQIKYDDGLSFSLSLSKNDFKYL